MNDAPGLGHNKPPEPTALDRTAELVQGANRAAAVPTLDEESAGRLQELLVQLQRCNTQIDTELTEARKPYDIIVGGIVKKYRDAKMLIGLSLTAVRGRLGPYLKEKEDRLKAEADQRRLDAEAAIRRAEQATTEAVKAGTIEAALEAANAIDEADELTKAAAKPVERAQIKGEYAPKAMSLVVTWSAEVIDKDKAFRHFGKAVEVKSAMRRAGDEAVRKLANKLAIELKDESRAPPGVRFIRKETAR